MNRLWRAKFLRIKQEEISLQHMRQKRHGNFLSLLDKLREKAEASNNLQSESSVAPSADNLSQNDTPVSLDTDCKVATSQNCNQDNQPLKIVESASSVPNGLSGTQTPKKLGHKHSSSVDKPKHSICDDKLLPRTSQSGLVDNPVSKASVIEKKNAIQARSEKLLEKKRCSAQAALQQVMLGFQV